MHQHVSKPQHTEIAVLQNRLDMITVSLKMFAFNTGKCLQAEMLLSIFPRLLCFTIYNKAGNKCRKSYFCMDLFINWNGKV